MNGLKFILLALLIAAASVHSPCARAQSIPEGQQPLAAEEIPPVGTFWLLVNPWPAYPPLPCPPQDGLWPIYSLGDGQFLIDNSDSSQGDAANSAMLEGTFGTMDDSGGGGLTPGPSPGTDYGSNLWLEIPAVTTSVASVVLHNVTQNHVYELMSTTILPAATWNPEQALFTVTNQDWIATTVPELDRTNELFFWARDWTDIGLSSNGIPQWWSWYYLDNPDLNGTNLDAAGSTLANDFANGIDPDYISFAIELTNSVVGGNSVSLPLNVAVGFAAEVAVLVNNDNFTNAAWQPLTSSNIVVSLNSGDGDYTLWVGLSGRSTARQAWQGATVTRDTTPPVITITNPVVTTVSRPLIQVQGYVSETLGSFTFDLANAVGTVTNQPVFITGAQTDTNLMKFTTNYFHVYDVVLTNGLNTLTLRATDLAGNVTTTNLILTLDYTTATNPPTITVVWPTPDTLVAGTSFTLRGSLNDDSASVSVSDSNGNVVPGLVERGGGFSVANLAMSGPTNTFVVSATNAAGYGASQTVTVLQSPVSVTVDPLAAGEASQPFVTVTGTVSAGGYDVWVNGIQASVNTNNTWEADGVPNTSKAGTSEFDVSVYPTGSNPATTPSSGDKFVPVFLPSVVQLAGYVNSSAIYARTPCCGTVNLNDVVILQTWQIGVGGQSVRNQQLGLQQFNSTALWPGNEPPITTWQNASFQTASSQLLSGDCCVGDSSQSTTTQKTQSQIQLVAAGPAQPGVMQLIHLTASALVGDNGDPAPASSILLSGQPLTPTETNEFVGETDVAVPAGSTQTIPITILGATNYTFGVQANTPHLSIQVNGVVLSTNSVASNANFCVGQMLTFSTNWTIVPQGVQSRSTQWLFEGLYDNDSNQPSPTSSINYTNNVHLLTNETTSAWWVSGSNPPVTYQARLTETLTLSNGSFFVLTANGLFSMLQPLPNFYAQVRDVVRVGTNFGSDGEVQTGYRLQFGINTSDENVGIAFVYTNAPLDSTGSTYGEYFITQVVSNFREQYNVGSGSNCVGTEVDGSGLDHSVQYNNYSSELSSTNWTDAPGGGLTSARWLSITDSFQTWLMFKPKPYSSSIAVPLFNFGWSWAGSAITNPPSGWVLLSSNTPPNPTVFPTLTFPIWSANITNNQTTITNLGCFNEN